jgi:2-methylcitrate dehydratase PrpD
MFGGERGFFKTFSDQWDLEKLVGPADYFEIERIYVKPYASCRHSHSAVEAAIKLHDDISITEIQAVEVHTYKLGVKGHDHTDIQGIASAKLSTPYASLWAC